MAVAFVIIKAHSEMAILVGLSSNGMGYFGIGQWFPCFNIDHSARMVSIADILRRCGIEKRRMKINDETGAEKCQYLYWFYETDMHGRLLS